MLVLPVVCVAKNVLCCPTAPLRSMLPATESWAFVMTAIKSNTDGKKPPWKAKPRAFPIKTNSIGCSLPEIPRAISKQNSPQVPLHPTRLVVVLAATFPAYIAIQQLPNHSFSFFFFFPDGVHGSQCFTTCTLGEKESEGERINIYSVFIFSESMLQSGEL